MILHDNVFDTLPYDTIFDHVPYNTIPYNLRQTTSLCYLKLYRNMKKLHMFTNSKKLSQSYLFVISCVFIIAANSNTFLKIYIVFVILALSKINVIV